MAGSNQSDFPDDWEDRKAAERYALHAREFYDQSRQYRETALRSHIDYAKWILASLLAVHGGMLYGISGLKASTPIGKIHSLVDAAGWSLIGIGCTLVVGFFIWLNFQCAEWVYDRWANASMLYDRRAWPADEGRFDPVKATMLLAVSFGMLSALCFAFSAASVLGSVR